MLDKIVEAIINIISIPIFLLVKIWRGRRLRAIILVFIGISLLLIYILGFGVYLNIIFTIGRTILYIGMGILHFVAIFWFMSQTKMIESLPGQRGRITFDDYFGSEHLVKLVRQWVSLLEDRSKLEDIGGEPISGILLIGEPGVGKTMLAKALSADVSGALIGLGGSDFANMFFGVSVLKMMQLFRKGRSYAAAYGSCIIFIDEIDAVAMNRGNVQGGGKNTPTGMGGGFMGMGLLGTMSRLLIEIEGLQEIPLRVQIQNRMRAWFGLEPIDLGTVLVMAATNRPDVLDPAILRPGRFDKKITVDLPDKKSRHQLFEGYLEKVRHSDDIDIDQLVQITAGVSQAFIASAITRDACRMAIFKGRDYVTQRDIEDALQELTMGLSQPISDWEPEQRRQVAIHESGHAIALYYLLKDRKYISRVSIVRRSGALGYVMHREHEDRYAIPLSVYKKEIIVSLAGHVATDIVMGEPWTGAMSDLNNVRARLLALHAHGEFGEIPLGNAGPLGGEMYSKDARERVDNFVERSLKSTRKLLINHRTELDRLTDVLLQEEELTGEEAVQIIEEAKSENL